ncbi:MAG TPA: serine/threonine-protein kinase [Polyangia bacterium]|nr:serine/threonine-protein kinase [Polyangia bacterium]
MTRHDSDDSQKVAEGGAEGNHDAPRSVTAPSGELPRNFGPAKEIAVGSVLAERYQIEATLGQGGSGSVYRAWDRVLGEPIAIKILRADRARERSWIMRLAREVKVARAIRHPNVCRVFELGQADGHWFVTMELGTGQTLRTLFEEGRSAGRPLAERLADARATCAGLAAIHAVGIVHRDVTPQNVLRMGDGRLVISDFGLAIELTATTTMHGGTPNYMPPETVLGRRADQRSDVWQLGLILHELFFGQRPLFDEATGASAVRRSLAQEASPVEEEVARLVDDCLAVLPAARPATALAVAGRLAAAEESRPRSALQRAWLRARSAAWRNRKVAWVALAVVATGVIVRAAQLADRPRLCRAAGDRLAGLWDAGVRGDVRQAFAATGRSYAGATFGSVDRLVGDYLSRWSVMYTEACEATHVRGEQSAEVLDLRMACLRGRLDGVKALTQILAHADGPVVDHAVEAAGALRPLEPCADARLLRAVLPPPEDPAAREAVARIRAGIAGARALHDAGDEAGARAALETLVADAQRVGYAPALAEAQLLLGNVELFSGDVLAAEHAFKQAVWHAEASRDDEVKAEAATFLVSTIGRSERFAEANDWASQATAILERIGGHDRLRAWVEMHQAMNLELQGRNAEALIHDERSVVLKQRDGASPGDIARNLNNRALMLNNLGRYDEALADIDRAIHDAADELGRAHPLVGTFISNRGETLDRLGRHAAARADYQEALQIEERGYGPGSTNIAYPLTGLGESFLADGRPREARAPLERAAGIRQAHEPDAALVAQTNFALARALRGADVEPARAVALARAAEKTYAGLPAFAAQARKVAAWLGEAERPSAP